MKYKRLGELAKVMESELLTDRTNKNGVLKEKIPFVRARDLGNGEVLGTYEFSTAYTNMVPPNAVLISSSGIIGRVGIAGRKLLTDSNILAIVLRDGSNLLPKYLYYYLKYFFTDRENVSKIISGKRIRKDVLEQLSIPVLLSGEQKKTADILDMVERYSLKKTEMVDILNKYRKRKLLEGASGFTQKEKDIFFHMQEITESMERILSKFLVLLMYQIFGETDHSRIPHFIKNVRNLSVSEILERLPQECQKLLENVSMFQRVIYCKYYEKGRPCAIHEILREVQKEGKKFRTKDIQNALFAVDALSQLGLLSKMEKRKLLYHAGDEMTEENTVRDKEGNCLEISMWSCIF